MARRREVDADRKTSPTTRRSFLGLAAATAATAAGVGSAGAQADYETVTLSSGEAFTKSVGAGETWENVLIDATADGAHVAVTATGSDWTVRNVAVKGAVERGTVFAPSVPDPDGEAVVENVYLADGVVDDPGGNGRSTGVWVRADVGGGGDTHRGHITFRNVHVAGFNDNGLYCSGPAAQAGADAGTVTIEACCSHDNNVSQFRVGGTDGDEVRDSVCWSESGEVVPLPDGAVNARGVRVVDGTGTAEVSGCDITTPSFDAVEVHGGPTAVVADTRLDGSVDGHAETENVGESPSRSLPSGVPETPEAAASGSSGGA